MQETISNVLYRIEVLLTVAAAITFAIAGMALIFNAVMFWLKIKNREEKALEYVLLQIAVSRDNEAKIDAAEQFFSAFASLKKSGFKTRVTGQVHLSFEIVANPGDIRFYVSIPARLRDM